MGKSSAHRRAMVEQLRKEQQRKQRRQSIMIYGGAAVVAVAVLAVAIIIPVLHNRSEGKKHQIGYVAAPSAAATTAGCAGVVNDAQVGRSHVKRTDTVNYTVLPPSSGNHDEDPLPDAYRFYERSSQLRVERAVHSLEHGFVVGWYDTKLPKAEVDKLRTAAATASDRFIAVPWPRADFPEGRHFVLTAWDRTQRCTTVDAAVLSDFVADYANPGNAGLSWKSPTAPESGVGGGTPDVNPSTPATVDLTSSGAGAMTGQPQAGSTGGSQ